MTEPLAPAPRANKLLLGHGPAQAAFAGAAASGRLHHGWLISGPPGIGKATFAFRAARWLLAGGTTPDLSLPEEHPVFKRVAAGSHPDLFTVERRMKNDRLQNEIVVGTIQEAAAFMRLTPAEGGWRAVVVDGAEDMNPNAANALLKLLEEPPARAILFLVTAAPGRLLPTIRSRCRRLGLNSLGDGDMDALLQAYTPELEARQRLRLAGLAEGSIGAALTLAAAGGVAVAALVDEALAAPVSPARAQAMADALGRPAEADGFPTFMTLLRAGLARAARDDARAGRPVAEPRLAQWQELGRLERDVVKLNLDKRAAVIVALSGLHGP